MLNVDTSTQEFFFTGSDTGTPFVDFAAQAGWTNGVVTGGPNTQFDLTTDFWTPSGPIQHFIDLRDGGVQYFVSWFPLPPSVTASPLGQRTSYATATASQISFLESLNGEVLTSTIGTGFLDIEIVVLGATTPVPEPSTFVAFGLGLAGFGAVQYRRRKTASAE